ncbi:hypothetical protein BH20ACT23_BH20ACT23_03290 [soil metagenome]
MVQLAEQHEVLAAREGLVHCRVLAGEPDSEAHLGRITPDVKPGHLGAALVEAQQGAEYPYRRGLSRSVGTEQPADRPGRNREVEPVER